MKQFLEVEGQEPALHVRKPADRPPELLNPEQIERQMVLVQREQRANLLRSASFDDLKLRNPLWDILLDLLSAHRTGRQLSMSDLCAGCEAPESTALRMIHQLREKGYAILVSDRADRRRTCVSLSEKGEARFNGFLDWVDFV